MALRFYNTLTQSVEPFAPLSDNTVRMYTCGPTVYDFAHIGNFRTFVFYDLLRRWLRASGFHLDHVMNITDVDDKIIRNAVAQGKSLDEYTAIYTKAFLDDCATLRLERPEATLVRATEQYQRNGRRDSQARKRRLHLSQRRVDLLSHRKIQTIRQALAQRFQRHAGWRTRRLSITTTKRMRGISPCGKRRSCASPRGTQRRGPRAAWAGTSNAPGDGDRISGALRSICMLAASI